MSFTGVVCRLQICRSVTAQWFDSTFRATMSQMSAQLQLITSLFLMKQLCALSAALRFITTLVTQKPWNLLLYLLVSSYLLGLLAKIKCSISSSQPDLWDLGYLSQTKWLGRFLKPTGLLCLRLACQRALNDLKRDLGIAVPPRVAGTSCHINFENNRSVSHTLAVACEID